MTDDGDILYVFPGFAGGSKARKGRRTMEDFEVDERMSNASEKGITATPEVLQFEVQKQVPVAPFCQANLCGAPSSLDCCFYACQTASKAFEYRGYLRSSSATREVVRFRGDASSKIRGTMPFTSNVDWGSLACQVAEKTECMTALKASAVQEHLYTSNANTLSGRSWPLSIYVQGLVTAKKVFLFHEGLNDGKKQAAYFWLWDRVHVSIPQAEKEQ